MIYCSAWAKDLMKKTEAIYIDGTFKKVIRGGREGGGCNLNYVGDQFKFYNGSSLM